jgi:OOP family OmpA-OmpF porin
MIKTRKSVLVFIFSISLITTLFSCKSGSNSTNGSAVADSIANVDSVKPEAGQNPMPGTDSIFNINSVPITDEDLGQFPYLKLPDSYTFNYDKEISQKSIKEFDKEYFAVYGKLISEEGKTFKATLEKNRADGKRFNSLELQKSLDKAIADFGGLKLKMVPITNSEWKRIGEKELIEKNYGSSIDVNSLDDIQTYVIRTKTKVIWIQVFLLNDESGKITVLEQVAQP